MVAEPRVLGYTPLYNIVQFSSIIIFAGLWYKRDTLLSLFIILYSWYYPQQSEHTHIAMYRLFSSRALFLRF